MSKNAETTPFVLASASSRRMQLLREAGVEFEVVPPPLEELFTMQPMNPSIGTAELIEIAMKELYTPDSNLMTGQIRVVMAPHLPSP